MAMTPPVPGTTEPGSTGPPESPYPSELLADLHADALPPDIAAHISAHIAADPVAQGTLAALDRIRLVLGGLPVIEHEVPPDVQAATDRTLADIASTSRYKNVVPPARGR
ncbi:hypothetical protein [Gordonia sp. CPCC 205333]|uniref:hypothetical protein n=1 Tax=Gordonia sp. CPCC 205333 TaxID=3140790 RepID=UPI003AF39561